jgi:hypothetical protein
MGDSRTVAVYGKRDNLQTVVPSLQRLAKTHSKQFQLMNEYDLHTKVIDFIRKFYPQAIICPGLGENQITADLRIKSWAKGYQKGQPDIILLNKHKRFSGLVIELKSPTGNGVVSPEQNIYLVRLQEEGFKTLLSNDYDFLLKSIVEYFQDVQSLCTQCGKWTQYKHNN